MCNTRAKHIYAHTQRHAHVHTYLRWTDQASAHWRKCASTEHSTQEPFSCWQWCEWPLFATASASGLQCVNACMTAFKKHVLPRFLRPGGGSGGDGGKTSSCLLPPPLLLLPADLGLLRLSASALTSAGADAGADTALLWWVTFVGEAGGVFFVGVLLT